jgi:hypothetical protein
LYFTGCVTSNGLSTTQIEQEAKRCAQITSADQCSADTADQCTWIGYGRACQPGQPCVSGVCQGPIKGGGSLTDGGVSCARAKTACGQLTDATSCAADTVDQCRWYAYGQPCQAGQPCPGGVCQGPPPDPSCTDAGGVHVGCACPNGAVCVEENSAPIQCVTPVAGCLGGASACSCLPSSVGPCEASPDVSGLCLCTPTPAPSPSPSPTTPPMTGCPPCPTGEACVEQIGGPALANLPPHMCVTQAPCGAAGACACIFGQGTCTPSTTESNVCVCDNGIR